MLRFMTAAAPLLAALRAVGSDLPAAGAAELAQAFQPRVLDRGAALLRPGEPWRAAVLIGQGLVRMHFLRRDGREFNKNFFAEGALVCPITPAMWDAPSLFGMSCIERTQLWQADAGQLRQLLQRHGAWEPLQRALLVRLLDGKLQREHDLLALDGRQRYQAFCLKFPGLAARVPLGHLATYLGMTDVSLSRLRRGWRPPDIG